MQRNDSAEYEGRYQMATGTDDIYRVGQLVAWQEEEDLGRYYPAPCDEITGSAGEFFPQVE